MSLESRLSVLEDVLTPAGDDLVGVRCALVLQWPEGEDKPRWRCEDAAGDPLALSDADALAVFLRDPGPVSITWEDDASARID